MGLGESLERQLLKYRHWRSLSRAGPSGDFYRNGGKNLVVENLPVTSDDIVIDAGGFEGQWTAEMAWRYGCKSIVFEPIPAFAGNLQRRFSSNARIQVRPEGIGPKNEDLEFCVASDGSSSINPLSGERVKARIRDVFDVFSEPALSHVGCMKINIEGAEYDLLDRMTEQHLHEQVGCFLIQFHSFVPDAIDRIKAIQQALRDTHDLKWSYPFIWERWDRRERPS